MKRSLFFFIALLMQFSFSGLAAAQTETIKGTVVAYNPLANLVCVWHPCAVWLIVKIEDKKQARFVRINVEYFPNTSASNRGYPKELTAHSRTWRFKASRSPEGELPLDKYSKAVDENGRDITAEAALPKWRLLPGAENEKLPFGSNLPSYDVKSGKYKLIKRALDKN